MTKVYSFNDFLPGMDDPTGSGSTNNSDNPQEQASFNPVLPVLWWLGILIALVLMRVAYEFMD